MKPLILCQCRDHECSRYGTPCPRTATEEDLLCDVCRGVPLPPAWVSGYVPGAVTYFEE